MKRYNMLSEQHTNRVWDIEATKGEYVKWEDAHKEIERLRDRVNEIDDYNPGILNDYGEGDVGWWQDYIRSEIAICNDHWRQALRENRQCLKQKERS